jgi:Tfp pilus assembly protein PilO
MSETNWKSPGAIIGILSALVAIVGLYFTFLSEVRNDQKLKNETEQAQLKINQEEERERVRQQERQEKLDRVKTQIDDLENQISTCIDNIGRANMEIALTCGEQVNPDLNEEERDQYHNRCVNAQEYLESNIKTKKILVEQKATLEKDMMGI